MLCLLTDIDDGVIYIKVRLSFIHKTVFEYSHPVTGPKLGIKVKSSKCQ